MRAFESLLSVCSCVVFSDQQKPVFEASGFVAARLAPPPNLPSLLSLACAFSSFHTVWLSAICFWACAPKGEPRSVCCLYSFLSGGRPRCRWHFAAYTRACICSKISVVRISRGRVICPYHPKFVGNSYRQNMHKIREK